MIVYLDTSAVVPLLVQEPSTQICRRLWGEADERVTSRLTFVETAAALAAARRLGRLSQPEHYESWSIFVQIWPEFDVVEVDRDLSESAARMSSSLSLRGYDAVHCASAVAVDDETTIAASGDGRLLAAWRALELAVVDTSAHD